MHFLPHRTYTCLIQSRFLRYLNSDIVYVDVYLLAVGLFTSSVNALFAFAGMLQPPAVDQHTKSDTN